MYFVEIFVLMCCTTLPYDGTVTVTNKLIIAYNNSLRILQGTPKYNSASETSVQLNKKSLGE